MSTRTTQMPTHQERIKLAQNFIDMIVPITALSSGYIDIETTGFISGYTREGAKRGLARLTRQGFMHEYKVPNMTGQQINIYGLTREGWDYADIDRANWTKQRYRANTRTHEMTILKLAYLNDSKTFYRATNVGGKHLKSGGFSGGRYPDLMNDSGSAIEIELTMKSSRRYVGILHNYHKNKTKSVWFTPEKIAHRLARTFGEICESKKYLKPEIASFDENLSLTKIEYSSIKTRVKGYTSLDQIADISELTTLLELYRVNTNLAEYKYKPNIDSKSKKGMVISLPNGLSIVAKLLDGNSKTITDLYWQDKTPKQIFEPSRSNS